jgi:hypothetical protein
MRKVFFLLLMLAVVARADEQKLAMLGDRELARVTGAKLITLSGDCGHLAPGCESEVVAREVARFLTP